MLREEDRAQSLEVAEELEKLSLSRLESKIYVELLQSGPKKASDLSLTLDVNRVDVYRTVKKMRKRGILEFSFSKPLQFSAVEPQVLNKILISEQELALRKFNGDVAKVCERLSFLPKIRITESESSKKNVLDKGYQFQLKQGRQVFEKWKKMVENSEDEIMIILSHVGLMTHSLEGFSDLYSRAARRGVTIKMITEVDKENFNHAVEFSKVCTLKLLNSVSEILRYLISDDKEAMISGGYPSNDPKEFAAICTNNSLLVKSLRLDFRDKWRKARPFRAI